MARRGGLAGGWVGRRWMLGLPGILAAGMAGRPALAQGEPTLPAILPLSPNGQPVPGYPGGAPATPSAGLVPAPADIDRLRAARYRAGIAMQALDTPWNALQVEALTITLRDFGIEVVAVTDAAQDPVRQAGHLAAMIERRVNVLFSVPIDPASQTAAYRRVADAGIKLVFMDNVVHGMAPGRDYVTVVASDNRSAGAWAAAELVRGIGGQGEIGMLTYHYESYYSVAARREGFLAALQAHPGVRVAATDSFVQPREAYQKTIAILRRHPGLKGLFAVWGDPAMQAVAAARSLGRTDLVVTTIDLGPDTALYMARGEILAIAAQLPFDLGVAEANAAALALLNRPVPPYIALPVVPVRRDNLIPALERVTRKAAPPQLRQLCAGACG